MRKFLSSIAAAALLSGCVCGPSSVSCGRELTLDGEWSFKLLATEKDEPADSFWKSGFDVSGWDSITVPSCWEMKGFGKPLYDERISGESGLYVRRFALPQSWPADGVVRIRFEGVMFGAKVWVNGREAADFTSSFNEHEFDITPYVRRDGENTVAVRTHGHPKGAEFDTHDDWTLHGIFRSVAVVHRPAVHLKKWYLTTKVDGADAVVSLKTEVSGAGRTTAALYAPNGDMAAGASGSDMKFTVRGAKFWSAESPDLYRLEISVLDASGRITETVCAKVGLKEVTWDGGVVKVNGRPVKLRGVNHHDITPENGRAVTDAEQWRDVRLIKGANCNFIRTSHYPPSKALLDACDELGVYVMDEIPFGLGNRFLDDVSYGPILLERTELTLARDVNRASVIAWSVGNENHVTPITLEAAKRTKALDPSRPWCFPMQPHELMKTLKTRPASVLGDLVNWHYAAICGEPEQLKTKYFLKFDRPYLSGEYAHSYGLDFGLLEWYWSEMMWNDPYYAGGAVWMFQDQGIRRKASDMTEKERANCVWPDKDHVWDSSGSLGTDGVVYSDRTKQNDYFEMRKVYSPVRLGEAKIRVCGGRFTFDAPVENRFDSLVLRDGLCATWKVFADRGCVARGKAEVPALDPHVRGMLCFGGEIPPCNASVSRIEVSFVSKRDGRAVYERSYPVKVDLPSAAAAMELAVAFDGKSKEVVFRGSDGSELMRTPLIARVDRRPMLSKDLQTKRLDRWSPNALEPSSVKVVESTARSLVLEAVWKPQSHTLAAKPAGRREIAGTVSFKVESGRVRVDYSLRYAVDRDLVETGLALELSAEFRRFDWVGKGPYECYPLVEALSEFGIWSVDRGDLRFSGNRRDVALALVSAADGRKAAFSPVSSADFVFERRGEKTLVGHNAFVAGKACKFNLPRMMSKVKAGEELKGAFYFMPPVREMKGRFDRLFGDTSVMIEPFMPFFRTYDF